MKCVIFSGTHPRHFFVHQSVLDAFDDVLAIVMQREETLPAIPPGLHPVDAGNFERHFRERHEIEQRTYGPLDARTVFGGGRVIFVSPEELNGAPICEAVRDFAPDIAFIFGTDLIKSPLIDLLPLNKINLHLGLSPWYKGAATLFWPFYFMQPQFAGVTFHQIVARADAGEIIHQSCPELYSSDGIHDVGARCVVQAAADAKLLMRQFARDRGYEGKLQRTTGRVWRGKDFHASHLRVIYSLYDNDIVDHYLAGELGGGAPLLFSCLKRS